MPLHPSIRPVQLGLRSLGYDPGPIDSWWGAATVATAEALQLSGPAKMTAWAVSQLQTGLAELGHRPGPVDGIWGPQTRAALGRMIDADGYSAASVADPAVILEPEKTVLRPVQHGSVLRQGSPSIIASGIGSGSVR